MSGPVESNALLLGSRKMDGNGSSASIKNLGAGTVSSNFPGLLLRFLGCKNFIWYYPSCFWPKVDGSKFFEEKYMSKRCELTGVGPTYGNTVSHANNHTRRRWLPNLKRKRIFNPKKNHWMTLRLTTSALKTLSRKGFSAIKG